MKNFSLFLTQLGNPEKKLNTVIHVAGTNGKGSTIAFLQHVLQQAGYSTGTFTSPHLNSYTERIAINNSPVTTQTFANLFNQCSEYLKLGLTEFELLTLMALVHFKLFSLTFAYLKWV